MVTLSLHKITNFLFMLGGGVIGSWGDGIYHFFLPLCESLDFFRRYFGICRIFFPDLTSPLFSGNSVIRLRDYGTFVSFSFGVPDISNFRRYHFIQILVYFKSLIRDPILFPRFQDLPNFLSVFQDLCSLCSMKPPRGSGMTLLPWIAKNIELDCVLSVKDVMRSRDHDICCFLMSFGRDGVTAVKKGVNF